MITKSHGHDGTRITKIMNRQPLFVTFVFFVASYPGPGEARRRATKARATKDTKITKEQSCRC